MLYNLKHLFLITVLALGGGEWGEIGILVVSLVEIFAKGQENTQYMIMRCTMCVCLCWQQGQVYLCEWLGVLIGTKAGRWVWSMKHAIFTRKWKKNPKPADNLTEVFWNVTHRSNSSLGSFLLMTASSLFVNIWKDAEDNISPGSLFQHSRGPHLHPLTSLKDSPSISARINDRNLISWDRFNVKPWKTKGDRR